LLQQEYRLKQRLSEKFIQNAKVLTLTTDGHTTEGDYHMVNYLVANERGDSIVMDVVAESVAQTGEDMARRVGERQDLLISYTRRPALVTDNGFAIRIARNILQKQRKVWARFVSPVHRIGGIC